MRIQNNLTVKKLSVGFENADDPSSVSWQIKNTTGLPISSYGAQVSLSDMGGRGTKNNFTITFAGGNHDYCTTARECYGGEMSFARFDICNGSCINNPDCCHTFVVTLYNAGTSLNVNKR